MVGLETCVLSINQTSTSLRKPWWSRCKNYFEKLLFDIFHVTTLNFSNITFIVVPSTSKMVGGVTYILFNAWLTAQQVNQTFIVALKTMVYFIRFFSGKASKFVSNIYALRNLIPRTTTPSAPYLSFNRIQLTSYCIIFYFLALL